MNLNIALVTLALFLAPVLSFQSKPVEKKPEALKVGAAAPDFTYADLDGTRRKLSDLKSKVVLIDFWGTWCGPCVAAVPKLLEAYEKYHARGFEIIGVDTGDTKAKLQTFLTGRNMTWAQTMEDDDGPIATMYKVMAWPSYFLIDREGKIAVAAPNGGQIDLAVELAKLIPDRQIR